MKIDELIDSKEKVRGCINLNGKIIIRTYFFRAIIDPLSGLPLKSQLQKLRRNRARL